VVEELVPAKIDLTTGEITCRSNFSHTFEINFTPAVIRDHNEMVRES
jgi:hypothetical protein